MDRVAFIDLLQRVKENLVTELSISFNDFVPKAKLLEEFIVAVRESNVLMKVELSNLHRMSNLHSLQLVKAVMFKEGVCDFSIKNSNELSSEIVKLISKRIADPECQIKHLGIPRNIANEDDWQYLIYCIGKSQCLAHLSVFNGVFSDELSGKFNEAFKKNGVTIIFNDNDTENLEPVKELKNRVLSLLNDCYCAPLEKNWMQLWFKDPNTGRRPKFPPNLLSKKSFFPEALMLDILRKKAAINYLMYKKYNEDFDIGKEIFLLKNPQNRLFHWILKSSHLLKLLIDALDHSKQDENSLIIRRIYFKARHFILEGEYGEILRKKLYDFEEKFHIEFDSAEVFLIKSLLLYDQAPLAGFLTDKKIKKVRFEYVRLRSYYINSGNVDEINKMKEFEEKYEINPHELNDLNLDCQVNNAKEEYWLLLNKEMMNLSELAWLMLISHSVILENLETIKGYKESKQSLSLSL